MSIQCMKTIGKFDNWQKIKKKFFDLIFYRPYVCELCGYKTAAPSTLNAHKRMVHEKQRPFVCETCGRSFAAKAGMENHILLIHNKVCSILICFMTVLNTRWRQQMW